MVSSPKMPAAPDPVATANAQSAVNRETAITNATMSHVNQTSPYGSQIWALDQTTPGGRSWQKYYDDYAAWEAGGKQGAAPGMPDKGIDPQWSLTTSLSPAQQQMFSSTNSISQKALDTGLSQLNRVSETLATPLSTAGLPERVTAVAQPSGFDADTYLSNNPEVASWAKKRSEETGASMGRVAEDHYNWYGRDQGKQAPTLDLISSVGNVGDVKSSVDGTSRGVSYDIAKTAQGVRYDPGYTATQYGPGDIQFGLDYSGVSALPGKDDFATLTKQARDAVYNQAASRLDPQFERQQRELEARLANQGLTPGSEAWAAQVDAFNRSRNDAYNQATFSSVSAGDALQQALYQQALQARQQGVSEVNTQGQFANAAEAQRFGQQIAGRQQYVAEANGIFDRANAAQAQDFSQNAARAQFANAAQAQEYGQNLQNAQFANAAQNQAYQQGLMNVNLSNSVNQQRLANAYQAVAFQNAERTNALNEASTLRSAPLAEMAGLMGMNSYAAPTFSQVASPQMAAPDLMGATYQSYQGQLAAAQARAQAQSGLMGSLAGLAGNGLMAYAAFSDRRLKVGARRLGVTLAGLPLYAYRYVWGGPERVGFMADEVAAAKPWAVSDRGGYLMVDYAAALAA